MNYKNLQSSNMKNFEQIRHTDKNGNEYWLARHLAKVLGYSEYRHFLLVIDKAKEACTISKQRVANHFEDILEMVKIGYNATRKIPDIRQN